MISKRAFIERVATNYLLTKIARRLDSRGLPAIDGFSTDSLAEEMGGVFFQLVSKLPLYSQNEGKLVGQLDQQGALDQKIIGRLQAQITKDDLVRAISGSYEDEELQSYLNEQPKLASHVQELMVAKAGRSLDKKEELTQKNLENNREIRNLRAKLRGLSKSNYHPEEVATLRREIPREIDTLERSNQSNEKLLARIEASLPTEVSLLKTVVLPTLAQQNFYRVFLQKMKEKQEQYKGFGDNLRKRLETPLKELVEDFFAKKPLLRSILSQARFVADRVDITDLTEGVARDIDSKTSLGGVENLSAKAVQTILNSYLRDVSELAEEARRETFNDPRLKADAFLSAFKKDSSSSGADQALEALIKRGRGSYLDSLKDQVEDLIFDVLQNRLKESVEGYESESSQNAREMTQIIRDYFGSASARQELFDDWELDETYRNSFLDFVVDHIREEASLSSDERSYVRARLTQIIYENESKGRPLIAGVEEMDLLKSKDRLDWLNDSEEEDEY